MMRRGKRRRPIEQEQLRAYARRTLSSRSTPMPRFLAVYTMKPENVVRFRALPKAEQEAIDAAGLPQWLAWEKANAASFRDRGMVGKTVRVTKDGIADAKNDICG